METDGVEDEDGDDCCAEENLGSLLAGGEMPPLRIDAAAASEAAFDS
jgi:hypothetical protein